MANEGYLLDNAEEEAGSRFDALAKLFDPSTFRHLDALGIGPSWHCWEVGAGGPSVLHHLVDKVGPSGRVVATDIDISWLSRMGDTVEVLRHDVAQDAPLEGPFDLIHARLVLVHVVDRDAAMSAMVSALRPGGWLFIEDADPALQPLSCPDVVGPDQELANHIRSGFRALMAGRGVDLAYGRTLPRRLREQGLEDVAADAYFPLADEACNALELATVALIRSQLLDHGIADEEQIARHLANVKAGRLDLAQPPMISAWGRKPL